ncbi:MAG: hypothetical protein ABIX12_10025 [Rubrivivax sp.]
MLNPTPNAVAARPLGPQPPRDPAPRTAFGDTRASGDEFERLLRNKSMSRDDDDPPSASDDAPTAAGPGQPGAIVGPASGAAGQRGPRMSPSPAGLLPAPSETAARLGRAVAGDAPAPNNPASGLRTDAAQTFEVTLNDPRGIGLELRAQRAGGSQVGAAQAPWSLTIGSGVVDASVLARHAPRLNERLQARVVTHGHVRIEGQRGSHDGEGGGGREGSA